MNYKESPSTNFIQHILNYYTEPVVSFTISAEKFLVQIPILLSNTS